MSKIYLDLGHGGHDSGAVGNGLKEKDLNLKIGKYTREHLQNNYVGFELKMSRNSDSTKSLKARTDEANKWGADIFVSIHINAGGGTGFESFVYTNVGSKTKNLQKCIHDELMKIYKGFRDRGKKQANFHVLRESKMSAVLTENLFIDSKKDSNFLKNENNLKKIGQAHADGIAKFLGLHKRTKIPAKKTNVFYRVVTGSFQNLENAEKRVQELKNKGFNSFIDVYKK